MVRVDLYTKDECSLCDEVKAVLEAVRREVPFELHEHDITRDAELFERYRYEIPVVHVDGHKAFKYRLDPQALRARLLRAEKARSMDNVKLQPLVSMRVRAIFLVAAGLLALVPVGRAALGFFAAPVPVIPAALEGEPADRPASDFTLKDLSGRKVRLSQLRGKTVFLNFWASWCPPCVEELPSIVALKQHFEGRPFEVLAVSEDDTVADVRRFFGARLPPFPVLMDEGQRVTRAWGTFKFPETYVVDPRGRVIAKFIGGREWSSPEAIAYFERVVGR